MAESMIDWAAIKVEYITSRTSYRKLGEKYGVHYSTICQKAKAEGWVNERKQTVNGVVAKTIEKMTDKEATHLIQLMAAAGKAVDAALEALADNDQFNRYIVQEGCGSGEYRSVEKVFGKLDTKALKEFVGTLKDLTGLVRNLYGLPTHVEAATLAISLERLEIERMKAARFEVNDDDNETGVVILPARIGDLDTD